MTMKLYSLNVQGFRAFDKPVRINLHADSVIIYGNNGTGKTSIIDAIEWALYGHLARFQRVEEFKQEPIYQNVHSDNLCSVQLVLGSTERTLTIDRNIQDKMERLFLFENGNKLEGKAAQEAINTLIPQHIFQSTVSLGQRELSNFVNVLKPSERYDALAEILGFARISDFRASLQDELDKVKAGVREITSGIEQTNSELQTLKAHQSETSKQLSRLVDEAGISLSKSGRSISAVNSRLRASQKSLLSVSRSISAQEHRIAVLRDLQEKIDTFKEEESELNDLQSELPALQEEYNQLVKRRDDLTRRKEVAEKDLELLDHQTHTSDGDESSEPDFLRLSIEHLNGPICPLCGQRINQKTVRKRLISRLEIGNTKDYSLKERQHELSTQLPSLTSQLRDIESRLDSTKREKESIERRLEDLEKTRTDLMREARKLARRPVKKMSELNAIFTRAIQHANSELHKLNSRDYRLRTEVRALTVAEEIGSPTERIAALSKQLGDLDQTKKSLEKVRKSLDNTIEWSRLAETEVIQETLDRYARQYSQNYAEMDPHPYFKELELKARVRNGKSEFVIRAKGKERSISVRTGFSEAQSNCVALCIFLALSAAKRQEGLDTMILDDPVQTMDDMNVVGFVDLLRRYLGYRQVIIATPNRDFYRLLSTRLSRRGTNQVALSIVGYTKEGPVIRELESLEPPAPVDLSKILSR